MIDFVTTFLTKPDKYLLKFRNIGKKTFEDYKSNKREFVLLLGKTFSAAHDEWISFFSNHIKVADNIKAVTDYYNAMSEETRDYLDDRYRNLLRNNIRLSRILNKYSVIDFITTFLTKPDEYLLKFRNVGRKTFEDYTTTKQSIVCLLGKVFYDFYSPTGGKPIIETTEESRQKDKDYKLIDIVKKTYGDVVDKFVNSFVLEHRYLPMFYLMRKCLLLTKGHKLNDILIDSLYDQDFSVAKCADKHNVSRVYVSYIRKKLRETLGKLIASSQPSDWYYLFGHLDEIGWLVSDSPLISTIQEVEHCTFSDESILHIMGLVFKDEYILYDKNELTLKGSFLIKKSLIYQLDFKRFIDDFTILYKSSTNEYTLNLNHWISSLKYFNYSMDSIDKIHSAAYYLVENVFDLHVDEHCNVRMPITARVDTVNAIYEILNEKGEPMTLDEIYLEFKKRYPSHKYTSASQLRSSLQRSEEVDAIGKRSTYALKKWTNISKGTIRSHIFDLLNKSDTPMHIKNITEYVMRFYPDTNEKNVMSTIVQSDKFIRFKGSLVGLATKDYPVWYSPIKGDTLRKKTFEERLVELEAFIKEKGRLPNYGAKGDETEASLGRWYRRAIRKEALHTPDQMEHLEEIVRLASDNNSVRAELLLKDFLPNFSFTGTKSLIDGDDADTVK